MTKPYRFLPLVLIALLVACGVSSDSTTNVRPTPPAVRPEAQRPPVTEQAESVSDASPWYEHYDLSEIVVRIGPGALAASANAEPRMKPLRIAPQPTRLTYSRRLQNLQQVRERLLRENAALSMKLALQAKQPTSEELGTLRTQLGRLSAQQRLVMSKTQVVEVEHQALLTLLAQSTAKAGWGGGN